MKLDCQNNWYCPYRAEFIGYGRGDGLSLTAKFRIVPRKWHPVYWVLLGKRHLRWAIAALFGAIGVVITRRVRK